MNLFRYFKWYRRLKGGRWELWLYEEGFQDWHQWDSVAEGKRPHPGCRGTPTIEVYD